MRKTRKQAKRSDHYKTMATGYQLLKSPLAESYNAAAEHYRESDPSLDLMPESTEGRHGDLPGGHPGGHRGRSP
jgi:hypothetical protein